MDNQTIKAKLAINIINNTPNLKNLFRRNSKSQIAYVNTILSQFKEGNYTCNEFLSTLSLESLVNLSDFFKNTDKILDDLQLSDFNYVKLTKKAFYSFAPTLNDKILQSLNAFNISYALTSEQDRYIVLLKQNELSNKSIAGTLNFYFLRYEDINVHSNKIHSILRVKDVLNSIDYTYIKKTEENFIIQHQIKDDLGNIRFVSDKELEYIFYNGLKSIAFQNKKEYLIEGKIYSNLAFKNLIASLNISDSINNLCFNHLTFEDNYPGFKLNDDFKIVYFTTNVSPTSSGFSSMFFESTSYTSMYDSNRKSKLNKDKAYKLREIVKDNHNCNYVIADESFLDIITEGKKYKVLGGCRIIVNNKVSFNPEKLKFKICE